MNELLTIIGSAAVSIFWADLSGIMNMVKKFTRYVWYKRAPNGDKWPRRLKPFDCSLCLSFWICLYLTHEQGWEKAILYAAMSSVLSVWMLKQVKK